MNELQLFSNPKFGTVRTILIDNEPWAVGIDVAKALAFKEPSRAVRQHVDPDDRMGVQNAPPSGIPSVTDSLGRIQHPTWINESGLYSLVFSSKLKEAKEFKRWVTSEILPTLRKTGRYTMQNAEPEPERRIITTDDYLTAARIISGCRNERMPYVVKLLKQAGIEIEIQPKDAKPTPQQPRQRDPKTAKLLTVAIEQYGLSRNAIVRHTGLWDTQISRMQKGTAWYVPERAKAVRDAIHELIPQLDIDAIYDSVT